MKTRCVVGLANTAMMLLALITAGGCLNDHVVFTTSTKFALDISQQADQPPKILLGYKREEGVFLPSPHKPGTEDSTPVEAAESPTNTTQNTRKDNDSATTSNTAKKKSDPASTLTRNDTYSIVSYFCVMTNPSLWDAIRGLSPFSKNVPDGLQIHSFFATGLAAQHAAENKDVRDFYQRASASPTERAEKRCY